MIEFHVWEEIPVPKQPNLTIEQRFQIMYSNLNGASMKPTLKIQSLNVTEMTPPNMIDRQTLSIITPTHKAHKLLKSDAILKNEKILINRNNGFTKPWEYLRNIYTLKWDD